MKSYLSEPGNNYEDFQDAYGLPHDEMEKSGYIKKYEKSYLGSRAKKKVNQSPKRRKFS